MNKVVFWFRRDLRVKDNHGLFKALTSGCKVLPIFIFDEEILGKLESREDLRVQFIFEAVQELREQYPLCVLFGKPVEVFKKLISEHEVAAVYTNEDYEPDAIQRDERIRALLQKNSIEFKAFKDHVIFSPLEVLKSDQTPYLVFTPYSRRWKELFKNQKMKTYPSEQHLDGFFKADEKSIQSLSEIGFKHLDFEFPKKAISKSTLKRYKEDRNFPAFQKGTTHLGIHLRFGTISVRQAVMLASEFSETWLMELIWREFFIMILFHFPYSVDQPFKEKFANVPWRKDKSDFLAWCEGRTGYPMVDAGMRELLVTGFMHNRVRMIAASFLTKHLFIHWKWGERHFARWLLDFELASNVGNWQWVAGCGVDAAPYFRIFNPEAQQKKFDPDFKYIRKWVSEWKSGDYPEPIVDHEFARRRALKSFKEGL